MSGDSWSVVTIARERPNIMKRFISWHLAAGAREVVVYFDDPDDPMIAACAHLPQVRPVRCTPDLWVELKAKRKSTFMKRQNLVFRHFYGQCTSDWLLVIDADELIWVRDGTIADILRAQGPDVRAVRFAPAERISIPSRPDFVVRTAMTPQQARGMYGRQLGWALANRKGLVGHMFGKSFHRTGQTAIKIRQHFAQDRAGKRIPDVVIRWEDGGAMLHLMNSDFEEWRRKLPFRLHNFSMPARLCELMEKELARGDEELILEQFRSLFTITPHTLQKMEAAGVVHRPEIDPDHAVAMYFPDGAT